MINKVILIGRVGKSPETRQTGNGTHVASFTVATSEKWKDKDGEYKEATEWHNVVAWKNLADIVANHVEKGMLVYVEGKLTHRTYEDNSGNTKYVTEIQCSELRMLSPKSGRVENPEESPRRQAKAPSEPEDAPEPSDDLPF